MRFRIFLIFVLALALTLSARPVGSQTFSPFRLVPLGFCTLAPSAATLLSACAGGIPAGATLAQICTYTQAINYRDDGTTPTATVGTGGIGLAVGSCVSYAGNLAAVQLIQQTASAVVAILFYRAA